MSPGEVGSSGTPASLPPASQQLTNTFRKKYNFFMNLILRNARSEHGLSYRGVCVPPSPDEPPCMAVILVSLPRAMPFPLRVSDWRVNYKAARH